MMTGNQTLYQIALSGVSALVIGALGALVGLTWASAVDGPLWPAAVLAAIAAIWGAIVVHLTPTGGTITENRTTVNYAVFALHAWYAFFLAIIALVILAIRSWVL
jgi:hypothetical protein